MTDRKQRISAAANAVKLALSVRRAEFENERHRIEGEVNEQGGGVALLSSGLAVVRFADEVQRELRKRSELARRAIDEALTLQELRLRSAMAVELKEHIRRAWVEEIEDLREWYQKRVSGANEEIAKERPFQPSAEEALQGVFVDVENKALAPGLWARAAGLPLWLQILVAIATIITAIGVFL